MNIHLKFTVGSLAAALALAAMCNFASGQTTTAAPVPGTAAPGPRAGRGGRQPRMEMALMRLRNAHTDLENALPDKGGNREIAIKDVDQAAASVEAGIAYAEAHADEFGRGARGARAGGARGNTTTTTPPTTTPPTTALATSSPSTPVGTPGAIHRQPRMEMALNRLRQARADLDAALPDKGGNREKAIHDIDQAIHSTEAGIRYADLHVEEFPTAGRGPRGGGVTTAAGEPRQPHMAAALTRLEESRRDLDNALGDKGGNREKAIADIDQAIASVKAGILYADQHPEEFPGRRGGTAGGTTTTPPTTTTTSTAPSLTRAPTTTTAPATTTSPNLILAPAGG